MDQFRQTLEDYTQGAVGRARDEILFAEQYQPLWKNKMSAAEFSPGDIGSASDIRRLPTTNKADFRRHFPHGVLVAGRKLTDPFTHRSQSSGTAGDRSSTVTYKFDLAARMSRTLSVNPAMHAILQELHHPRSIRYAAPNCSDVECATPFTTMQDRMLPDGMLVLPVAHDLLSTPAEMIRGAIDEWIEWRPHWIYADPTHLAFLTRQCRANSLQLPSCACIALTFTQTTRVARRQLARFFPADVVCAEVVSMSEFGWLAMECPLGTMHLNVDNFYLELLAGDRPTQVDEPGELVVTSIGDRLSPHVRYRTGDCFTLLDRCPCGHPFPAVRGEGRMRDMIVADGAIVMTPRQADLAFDQPWLDLYRLDQIDERRIDIRLVLNETYRRGDEEELRAWLAARLGSGVEINCARVASIPCERSGKFISCASRVAVGLAA